jgi:hypothetical protein
MSCSDLATTETPYGTCAITRTKEQLPSPDTVATKTLSNRSLGASHVQIRLTDIMYADNAHLMA